MTTRYERMKMQRRMQRRIRLVVEERRMALAHQKPTDPETTMEIPPLAALWPAPVVAKPVTAKPAAAPKPAVGRVTIRPA